MSIQCNIKVGKLPLFTSHITPVSVTTDTSVPTSTALEACSTQTSYCRANTNTLSAGGSAAISTAVSIQTRSNGPNSDSSTKTIDRMQQQLDRREIGNLPRHLLQRPQRHGDAEREQSAGRGGVLQELQKPVERDRRLEVHRSRGDAERAGDDQRMAGDAADHFERDRRHAHRLRPRQRHQKRHQREQDRCCRSRRSARPAPRPRAERGERQPRSHVADIAVSAGKSGNRGLRDIAFAERHADAEREREGAERRQRGRQNEIDARELFERRLAPGCDRTAPAATRRR